MLVTSKGLEGFRKPSLEEAQIAYISLREHVKCRVVSGALFSICCLVISYRLSSVFAVMCLTGVVFWILRSLASLNRSGYQVLDCKVDSVIRVGHDDSVMIRASDDQVCSNFFRAPKGLFEEGDLGILVRAGSTFCLCKKGEAMIGLKDLMGFRSPNQSEVDVIYKEFRRRFIERILWGILIEALDFWLLTIIPTSRASDKTQAFIFLAVLLIAVPVGVAVYAFCLSRGNWEVLRCQVVDIWKRKHKWDVKLETEHNQRCDRLFVVDKWSVEKGDTVYLVRVKGVYHTCMKAK